MQKIIFQKKVAACRGGLDPTERERRKAWRYLTRADKILIAAVLFGAIGLEMGRRIDVPPGGEAVVEVDGTRQATLSLDQPQKVQIDGPMGSSEVEIGAQGARIIRAPCPHGLCVRRGWVRRKGEMIVCVPNRLVLTIIGGEEQNDVDAVIR